MKRKIPLLRPILSAFEPEGNPVLRANVAFEIVISKKEDKLTKFGGSIKSGVLIQR